MHSSDLSRIRAILRQLIPSWDVAAGLSVLADSPEAGADEAMARDFVELLARILCSIEVPLAESEPEGLSYLRDWMRAQDQTGLVFSA